MLLISCCFVLMNKITGRVQKLQFIYLAVIWYSCIKLTRAITPLLSFFWYIQSIKIYPNFKKKKWTWLCVINLKLHDNKSHKEMFITLTMYFPIVILHRKQCNAQSCRLVLIASSSKKRKKNTKLQRYFYFKNLSYFLC